MTFLSKMAEGIRPSYSRSKFPGLIISNLVFTEVKLGRGADAKVYAVEWNGTVCAAKRLHEILLEDESPGGADKFISNFEAECLTWSKLRHPGVVQFLGVYMEEGSRLPVLVMEKMDTSLRTYLEDHSKEEFPLHQKTFVLRQVTQALAYLHSQNPPLVHHDLSSNNVLLDVGSFVTKVSDFGMSRAINPSALSRMSSVKGTQAFMPPEALHDPPRYNEKLDVFSFGNVVISTLTHEWPNPGPPTRYQGEQLVASNELQRREHFVVRFTAQEKQLFQPIVCQCLENRPEKRPSSVMLVQELRHIESTPPKGGHVAVPIEQLCQQLSAKEEECRQKDKVIREKDEDLKEKDKSLKEKDEAIRENSKALMLKDEALKEKDIVMRTMQADNQHLRSQNSSASERLVAKEAECRQKDEVVREKSATIRVQQAEIQRLRHQLAVPQKALRRRTVSCNDLQTTERSSPRCDYEDYDEDNPEGVSGSYAPDDEDIVMRTMQADIQQLSSQNSRASEQLAAKVAECRQSENVVREQSSTIQALPAEVQRLRDQPAVPQKVRHPPRDWRKLGKYQVTVIEHDRKGGRYGAVAVNSEGLIAVTDIGNKCVHLLSKEGALVRSIIGKRAFSANLWGITFDLKGNVWVTDTSSNKVLKLSQAGRLLQTIDHAGRRRDHFNGPTGVSVSPEGLIYICDSDNHSVTIHDEEGKFQFAVGSKGSGPRCFDGPHDVTFGSDGLLYVTDYGNTRVCVWSKEGTFQRDFTTKYEPYYIAASGDNHLVITSSKADTVMVYTLEGQLVHEFGGFGSDLGRFHAPYGICVDDSGLVYVADCGNSRVQVF